jgi:dodecin
VRCRAKAYYEGEPRIRAGRLQKEGIMGKKTGESVYKIVEVIGTSPTSWEEAAKRAVQAASKTLRDLRIAEVVKQDMAIENGKVVAYRTRMLLSFKYQA